MTNDTQEHQQEDPQLAEEQRLQSEKIKAQRLVARRKHDVSEELQATFNVSNIALLDKEGYAYGVPSRDSDTAGKVADKINALMKDAKSGATAKASDKRVELHFNEDTLDKALGTLRDGKNALRALERGFNDELTAEIHAERVARLNKQFPEKKGGWER